MLSVVAFRKLVSAFATVLEEPSGEGEDPAPDSAPGGALRGRRTVLGTARAILMLSVLGPAILAGDASAVTVPPDEPRPWTRPATNPCRELCGARWALDRMHGLMPVELHEELARRMHAGDATTEYLVATGDDIRAMSYAKEGVPFVDFSRRVAQFPQDVRYPAHGYFVAHDGLLYRFVRIEACGNWALIVEHDGAAPRVLSWLSFDRLMLLSELGDVIIGGSGDDSLGSPADPPGDAVASRRVSSLYPVSGTGAVGRPWLFSAGGFGTGGFGTGGFGPGGFGSGRSGSGGSRFGHVLTHVGDASGGGSPSVPPFPPAMALLLPTAFVPPLPTPSGPFSPTASVPPSPTAFVPPSPPPPAPPPPDHGAAERQPMPIPLPGTLALFAVWLAAWLAALGGLRLCRS